MNELREKIILALDDIEVVSDYLYQQKINKGYDNLNNCLAKIMELTDFLYALSKEGKLVFDEQRLIGNLTVAMKAMEDKDSVLLADILVYEIAGQLLELEL